MGEIGREMALRGAAFGMRNFYYQRTPLNAADEAALQAEYKPLEALLAESDWVVVTLPFNQSTRDFIGREQITQMKPGAAIAQHLPGRYRQPGRDPRWPPLWAARRLRRRYALRVARP